MGTMERAAVVPLTSSEIEDATALLNDHGICISMVQRRMRIGWNRAVDLIEHIKGREALPAVAINR